jgi:membrane fusion protein
VPQDSPLQVSLYAPSRAVGFVAAGDGVLLRFDAYPYQKFGQYGGVVSWVSRTALSPREIGALGVSPESVEPLYEIRVQPDAQTVRAYGATHPLQPGMAVEADIRIERRRLYEWILDPLYALTRST